MALDFKSLLKLYRLRANYGLRQFAEMVGESPPNYASVESGRREPWRSAEKLRKVATMLALREGTPDWDTFFIAARKSRALPPGMEHLLERPMIPVLLRTVDELRLSEDDLRALVDDLYEKRRGRKK